MDKIYYYICAGDWEKGLVQVYHFAYNCEKKDKEYIIHYKCGTSKNLPEFSVGRVLINPKMCLYLTEDNLEKALEMFEKTLKRMSERYSKCAQNISIYKKEKE